MTNPLTPQYLTLGELIERLKREPSDKRVPLGFGNPHSYRGFYEDLAFETVPDVTVADMLTAAESALGKTFEGYKGGDYTMDEYCSVWLAEEGSGGGETLGGLLLELLLAAPSPAGSVPLPTPTPTGDREALEARISAAILGRTLHPAVAGVMTVVDELLEKADRANRLLTRLTEEQQHRDPDVRARIRVAIEKAYDVDGVEANPLDAATDAVGAEVFPTFKALGVALEDRDKIIERYRAELATTREERDQRDEVIRKLAEHGQWENMDGQIACPDGYPSCIAAVDVLDALAEQLLAKRDELGLSARKAARAGGLEEAAQMARSMAEKFAAAPIAEDPPAVSPAVPEDPATPTPRVWVDEDPNNPPRIDPHEASTTGVGLRNQHGKVWRWHDGGWRLKPRPEGKPRGATYGFWALVEQFGPLTEVPASPSPLEEEDQ